MAAREDEGMILVGAMLEGSRMSEEEVRDLEKHLELEPDHLIDRVKVLSFYSEKDEEATGGLRHTLWIIHIRPDITQSIVPLLYLNDPSTAEYALVKEAWLQQLKERPQNCKILLNAASFFYSLDDDFSLELLNRAQAIEPKNLDIESELAHHYRRSAFGENDPESAKNNNAEALKRFENILSQAHGAQERFYRLTYVATTAFGAGKLERAEEVAGEMLRVAPRFKDDWNYGNAIYWANIVLGKIAFIMGDIDRACEYLLSGSRTPGSPQLNSFGPEFALCSQLLSAGKSDCALSYLSNCAKFWKEDILSAWTAEISQGLIPSFEQFEDEEEET